MTSIVPNPLVNYIFSSDLIHQQDVTQMITSRFFVHLFFLYLLASRISFVFILPSHSLPDFFFFFARSSSFSWSPEMSMSQVSVCKLLLFTLFFTQSLGNLMQPHSFTCCSPVLDSLYLINWISDIFFKSLLNTWVWKSSKGLKPSYILY